MAIFNPTPNPTNDPSYLGYSKEPEKIKNPYQGDVSGAVALQGLSDVFGEGVKAFDRGLIDSMKKEAREGVQGINEQHGGFTPTNEIAAIAGTGAKGKARTDANGDTVFDSPEEHLPASAVKSAEGLKRLQAAFNAGELSQSMFDARVGSLVSQLKTKYQGYEDQIDSYIKEQTTIPMANDLRKDVLNDLSARANSVSAADKEMSAYYKQNQAEIHTLFPGISETQFKTNADKIKTKVGDIKAEDFQIKQENLRWVNYDKADANRVTEAKRSFQRDVSLQVSNTFKGAMNALEAQAQTIRTQGANAKPEDVQALAMAAQDLDAKITNTLYTIANDPNRVKQGGVDTYSSTIGSEEINKIITNAKLPIQTVTDRMGVKEMGSARAAANITAHETDIMKRDLYKKVPAYRITEVMSKTLDPVSLNTFLNSTNVLPQLTKGIVDAGFLHTANPAIGPVAPISTQLEQHQNGNPDIKVPGQVTRLTVQGLESLIKSKDPEAAGRAVQALYDERFFAGLGQKDQKMIYDRLATPENLAKVKQLQDSGQVGVFDHYQNWVEKTFPVVYKQAIQNLVGFPGAAASGWQYSIEPKTSEISLTPKPGVVVSGPLRAEMEREVRLVQDVNRAIRPLRQMYDMKGEGETKTLEMMKTFGLDPTTTDQPSKFQKWLGNWKLKEGDKAPSQEPRPVKRDKFSMGDDTDAVKKVVASAESGDDYNAVFGMGKSTSRDLSQFTVGEIMDMQKGYVRRGSPSSAIGKYQFLSKTVASLVREGVISEDEPFTPDVQEKMADALLNRRGLADFRSGKLTKEQFVNNLAKEWAGLPTTEGVSHYSGDGLNKAQVKLPKVLAALAEING